MHDLNFNHLLYFWTVAREGSVRAACEKLLVAQPTVSSQIRALERSIGHRLFRRHGRGLALTEFGQGVFRYADEMFSIGRDLADYLKGGHATQNRPRLHVGIANVLPKLIVSRLLQPVLEMKEQVRLVAVEEDLDELISRLTVSQLDVVLSDAPVDPHLRVRAYNHLLGESRVGVFAPPALAGRYRKDFPRGLAGAPFLLPTSDTILRRSIDRWLERFEIRPRIIGEFADSALIKALGQTGVGLLFGSMSIRDEIKTQFDFTCLGELEDVTEQFYAISVERRFSHPAVQVLADMARRRLFGASAVR
ncbi:MAG: transcriptional activator NhaR [Phycisphaerales bacterium]|nr:transcriptional activator NhaR [Phycisphaerales bacterium]